MHLERRHSIVVCALCLGQICLASPIVPPPSSSVWHAQRGLANVSVGELAEVVSLVTREEVSSWSSDWVPSPATAADFAAMVQGLVRHLGAPLLPQVRRALQAWGLLAVHAFPGPVSLAAYGELSDWLRASVQHRLRRLAERRRGVDKGSGPRVYLLHISKTGGTTLCRAAHSNGCALHSEHNNCWVDGLGPLWMGMRHAELTCSGKAALYGSASRAGGPYTDLIANEGTMDGGALPGALPENLCLEDLVYVTILRRPLTRAVSHLNQRGVVRGSDRAVFEALTSMDEQIAFLLETKAASGMGHVLDNFMTRCLLGERTYQAPVGTLDPALARRASRVLAQFDVVLTLENDRKDRLLRRALGWDATQLDLVSGRTHRGPAYLKSPSGMQRLADLNRLDEEVYRAGHVFEMLDDMLLQAHGTPREARDETMSEDAAGLDHSFQRTCPKPLR